MRPPPTAQVVGLTGAELQRGLTSSETALGANFPEHFLAVADLTSVGLGDADLDIAPNLVDDRLAHLLPAVSQKGQCGADHIVRGAVVATGNLFLYEGVDV